MTWKDKLMENIYRINQSQRFYGIFASTLVIAALYYEDIPAISGYGFFGKLLLSMGIIFMFMFMGYIYDRKFKLWEQDHILHVKRNPYAGDLLMEKEKLVFHNRLVQMKSLKGINGKLGIVDKDLDLEIIGLENWIKDGRINGK